jgi:hypothetical protein
VSTYAIVSFLPNPGWDWRIPVAALVRQGRDARVVTARMLPDARCLGGAQRLALLRGGLASLQGMREPALPVDVGPHFVLDAPRQLPAAVEDPYTFVVARLLPTPVSARTKTRGEQRATLGYQFFEKRHVAQYVRKRFQPSERLALNGATKHVAPVSHWVLGDRQLMLMEPIVTTRASNLEHELQQIVTLFLAYRLIEPEFKNLGLETSLIVYLLGNGAEQPREKIREAMLGASDGVVDLADQAAQDGLVWKIEQIGQRPTLFPA